jgi:hypothetical protein
MFCFDIRGQTLSLSLSLYYAYVLFLLFHTAIPKASGPQAHGRGACSIVITVTVISFK